mmetsp:Transcript_25479/g.58591  ORF Transcript_25479/g.58591 Transcript_25479/m.58591 type:complete len:203 (-) Transcript_25479:68-676(-)
MIAVTPRTFSRRACTAISSLRPTRLTPSGSATPLCVSGSSETMTTSFTPSARSCLAIAGGDERSPVSLACPPVMATALLERILKVMLDLAATHALIERTAECTYVPSPTLTKVCFWGRNGSSPIQLAPSTPMLTKRPFVKRPMNSASVWHPIPPSAMLPAGTSVDRLCGHPAQKYGARRGTPPAPPGVRSVPQPAFSSAVCS